MADATGQFSFYTDAIILAFGTGAVLGEFYCRGLLQRMNIGGGLLALAGGLGLWLVGQSESVTFPHRFIAAGIPATLIVLVGCVIKPVVSPQLKWLKALGDATYSVYLGHVLVLGALRFAFKTLGIAVNDANSAWLFMIVALAGSALGGWVLYRCVEVPLMHLLATSKQHKHCT